MKRFFFVSELTGASKTFNARAGKNRVPVLHCTHHLDLVEIELSMATAAALLVAVKQNKKITPTACV